ncbi:protein adenylyltransferase SelO [Alkalicoccobacillus porphyridii]|uniref:Protein nucleotidyltransferase YdiU n=1 Tax=Alkalicoccobacillus porphyridii TaxID=2597270 RepID=A0A553ZW67_9BACI|nr:YdiU family protein [Alkalicoccobacillus porphyridii]TSB45724.1 YdiU family protein [Alkalicoccobacillus porphyridii]
MTTTHGTHLNVGWNFDNSYSKLPEDFFRIFDLNPVEDPNLVLFNDQLAKKLGLDADALRNEEGASIFAGNKLPEGGHALAQAYAGHQFGNLTMLGDGRALLIGEQLTPDKERFDIQLKGSGRTNFSRGGDGRAALGPMLREYIISEAMHGLGIPTTRSLAVVTTGELVLREIGLPGAIMTRVASSHLRVGTFQYAAGTGEPDNIKALADYAIWRHYPEVKEANNPYLALFQEVLKKQAALIAKWQLVGFIHGVMNTDNMSISGETIDYGPCAFMNTYNPETVFSSIDVQGRYAYGNQPYIANWNLARLAETLVPLVHEDQDKAVELVQEELANFKNIYLNEWYGGMSKKLGLFNIEEKDQELIDHLFGIMESTEADFTNTFRALTLNDPSEESSLSCSKDFTDWQEQWKDRLTRQPQSPEEVQQLLKTHNPAVIPRNHRVEEALSAAVEDKDYTVLKKLLKVMDNPYAYSVEQEDYKYGPGDEGKGYRTFCGT